MQGDRCPRLIVHDHRIVAFEWQPELGSGNVHPQMLCKVGFRAKSQPADTRVDAVRAYDKIKSPRCCLVEPDIDAATIRIQRSDHLLEEELRIITPSLKQDRRQLCAWHFQLPIFCLTSAHARHPPPRSIDED